MIDLCWAFMRISRAQVLTSNGLFCGQSPHENSDSASLYLVEKSLFHQRAEPFSSRLVSQSLSSEWET